MDNTETDIDTRETARENVSDNNSPDHKLCHQAGYLPVPLRSVPPEGLADLEVYLFNGRSYHLYRSTDLHFGQRDYQRLMDSGVEFVYVSVKDHQVYYRTIEESLGKIVSDTNIQLEQKTEILYSTGMELASQILLKPPGRNEIDRTAKMAHATVQLIMQDQNAFGRLFEISNHDFYTATHLVNVCSSSISLADKIGLADQQVLNKLGTGAMLHDIGKIFIPSELLNAPGKLTNAQYAQLQSHAELGRAHLSEVSDLPPEAMAVVTEHHERMDGSGYPNGLKGEQISIMGRLAGIVDTFDAMTSVRPYREHTFSVEDALQHLEDQAQEKFDKEIVKAFNKLMQQALNVDNNDSKKNDATSVQPSSPDFNWIETDNYTGRRHLRYHFRLRAMLRKIQRVKDNLRAGPAEKIIVHNISCSGIGLLNPKPLKLNENIMISIAGNDSEQQTNLIAVVIRCVDHADGWFTIGTKFHQQQSDSLIDKIRNITPVSGFSADIQ